MLKALLPNYRQLHEGKLHFVSTCICKYYENVYCATLVWTVISPGGSTNANRPATCMRWGTVLTLAVVCARYGFVDIPRPLSFLWGLSITNDFYSTVSLFLTAENQKAYWCVFQFRIQALCISVAVGLCKYKQKLSFISRACKTSRPGWFMPLCVSARTSVK
jgi:hypothetical protein